MSITSLESALLWVGVNCTPEACERLRSRRVAKALADEVFRLHKLRTAIHKTLDDNAHLADGENCTLLALKVALRETGEPWEGLSEVD